MPDIVSLPLDNGFPDYRPWHRSAEPWHGCGSKTPGAAGLVDVTSDQDRVAAGTRTRTPPRSGPAHAAGSAGCVTNRRNDLPPVRGERSGRETTTLEAPPVRRRDGDRPSGSTRSVTRLFAQQLQPEPARTVERGSPLRQRATLLPEATPADTTCGCPMGARKDLSFSTSGNRPGWALVSTLPRCGTRRSRKAVLPDREPTSGRAVRSVRPATTRSGQRTAFHLQTSSQVLNREDGGMVTARAPHEQTVPGSARGPAVRS